MIIVSKRKCAHQMSGCCPKCSKSGMGSDAFSSALSILAVQALPGVVNYVGKEISANSDPHAFSAFSSIGDSFSSLTSLFKSDSSYSPPLVANAPTSSTPNLKFVSTLPKQESFFQKYKTPIAISVVLALIATGGFVWMRRE